jgi:type I restriction enzyme, S subunit
MANTLLLPYARVQPFGRRGVQPMPFGALKSPLFSMIAVRFIGEPLQAEICVTLPKDLDQLDALTDVARSAIELLQEHRAALISAAVTGKIDVRDRASMKDPALENVSA